MSKMNLKFNPNLKYQKDAVKSVTDLFAGQRQCFGNFSIVGQTTLDSTIGVANKLDISKEDILKNLREVQTRNQLGFDDFNGLDFNIEMETGTGKTYVYINTILELNKLYGFTKFIVVVPNIAIKEGVYKTLEITKEHFKELYDNVIYDYFVYDSSKLERVRNFAVNSNIEIMIINIDSFNKGFSNPDKTNGQEGKENVIHRENDRLNGYKPIDLIAETNPIVIIDEPQSVVNTKLAEKAVNSLNPLCTLRYSATHVEIQNLVYKLDAVDAYEKHLVKQIEVASVYSQDSNNGPYRELISTNNKKSPITAKLKLDFYNGGKTSKKTVSVKKGDDLVETTGFDKYQGFIVNEIYCEEGKEHITFLNGDVLEKGMVQDDLPDDVIKRVQIRKTIDEHLSKMLYLTKKGIKVLSLFFIDEVKNYREYDEEGNPIKGLYAKIFEEEYNNLIKLDKYRHLNEGIPVEEVHNGYFSVDKTGKQKGRFKDSKEGFKKYDYDTYSLIMKDKEKLLSFNSNLQFIFSHSALREGWDNPNVFQICTLNKTGSSMKKRQEIGRGLRLCVNQEGERIKDTSYNILTIMANESYEEFAKSLQKEMEDDGIKFGFIEKYSFSSILMKDKKGNMEPINQKGSLKIFNYFKKMKYIDGKGKVKEALKLAISNNNISVPEGFESIKNEIIEIVNNCSKKYNKPKNAKDRIRVKINDSIFSSDEFKKLWEKICRKTNYSVDFDSEKLIKNCVNLLNDIKVSCPKIIYEKGDINIDSGGVSAEDNGTLSVIDVKYEAKLPNIVKELMKQTFLTRRTVVEILKRTTSLDQFKDNPSEYIEKALDIIKKELNKLIFEGIEYHKIDEVYSLDIFTNDLYAYLDEHLFECNEKSLYNCVHCDSIIEKDFARRLENDPGLKLYTKLPNDFKINTPIGFYNPDWAIIMEEDGKPIMYFVIETKGTMDPDKRRATENNKIKCGEKHFEALDTGVIFGDAKNYNVFKIDIVGNN